MATIDIKQLGIQKHIRVHSTSNGDVDPEEEIINRQWECAHEHIQTIPEAEMDPIYPDSTSLFYGTIHVCEDCGEELAYNE